MRNEYEPKEYYTVQIIPTAKEQLSDDHDILSSLKGKIELHIEALTPIFVGTGDYEIHQGLIYQPFSRRNEKVVIPGTSIKGVARAYAEALSPSCEVPFRSPRSPGFGLTKNLK